MRPRGRVADGQVELRQQRRGLERRAPGAEAERGGREGGPRRRGSTAAQQRLAAGDRSHRRHAGSAPASSPMPSITSTMRLSA
jgi:hypothetical protein